MKKLLPFIILFYVSQTNAQSYLVNFTGTGEASVVNEVKIQNLTTGDTRTLSGTDILRLNLPTGINDLGVDRSSKIKFFPNPMNEYSILGINAPSGGEAVISVYDISGKAIYQKDFYVEAQEQEFMVSGLNKGLYFINIKGKGYSLSGKLLSNGNRNCNIWISNISNTGNSDYTGTKRYDTKAEQVTVDMPYNTGQYLKFIGVSGEFSTVVTSTFTADKQISFRFIRCKDGDNINYPVVEIGSQVWMASNLRTTKYSNGDPIGTTTPQTLNISAETNPKYEWIYYGYQLVIDPVIYGRLYTWHAATDSRNVCPAGWHLPSRVEWNTLIAAQGGATVAGGKLKETGLTHWASPNEGATNISGFTGIPTGSRAPTGACNSYTTVSYLWSSTERDNTYAWYCAVGYNYAGAYTDVNTGKNVGSGIRCVKDQ